MDSRSWPGAGIAAEAPIRVLVADDVPELRTLLRLTLQGQGFELVGEATDGDEVVKLAISETPEVILLDLAMPGMDGMAAIAELRRCAPEARVVVLSAFATERLRREALQRGAHAYLEKGTDPETLLATVRAAAGRDPLPAQPQRLVPAAWDPLQGEVERIWGPLAAAPVATALVAADGRFVRVNQAFCRLAGFPESQLLLGGYDLVVHPEDRDADQEQVRRLLDGSASACQLRQRCRRADGEAINVLASLWLPTGRQGQPLALDRDGRPRYLVRQLTDVSGRPIVADQLAHRIDHDALTGLPNRAVFVDRLDLALARLGRDPGLVAVLMLDLDNFKETPGRFGNDEADRLLAAVGRRLRSILRPSDTVARFGSDEFAILSQDLGQERDALRLAERVTAGLTTPFPAGGQDTVVSASIGIALAGRAGPRPEALLWDAETAMRRAKQRGGGRFELVDERVQARLAERLEAERALKGALGGCELRAYYQPIVALADRRLVAVEALARWEHPQRGRLVPGEFLPLAEESGLIVPVGAWLLEEACRQAARWPVPAGGAAPPVAVNLSARQFAEPHLVDLVSDVLDRTGLAPSRLCLELTERALARPGAASSCKRLDALGVGLAVDDFGSGHSSLAALQRLPLSALKLDRGFVARLELDPPDDAVAAAVIGVAHALGLAAVAEGVETQRQLARLGALGCDHAQGHLFGGPQPAEQAAGLLAHARPAT